MPYGGTPRLRVPRVSEDASEWNLSSNRVIVAPVLGACGGAEIAPPVIEAVSVDVIHFDAVRKAENGAMHEHRSLLPFRSHRTGGVDGGVGGLGMPLVGR